VIGRVLDVRTSELAGALIYWQGQYVAVDRDEDVRKMAEVSMPTLQAVRKI
jgi:hypothetical protein